jgi:hypothetical protein
VVALILARPLERIGELPLEDLAREAPALCAQAIRALVSDTELERIAGPDPAGGRQDSASARRLGALAGARDAEEAVEAVEALRGVLWEAVQQDLGWPVSERSARQAAELADRLAYVCATALASTIAATVAEGQPVGAGEVALASGSGQGGDSARPPAARRVAVLVDERDEVDGEAPRPPGAEGPPPPQPQPRPLPWEVSGDSPSASRSPAEPAAPPLSFAGIGVPAGLSGTEAPGIAPGVAATPSGPEAPGIAPGVAEIEIRDERGEEGPSAWIRSIGRQLERFEQDGLPFAVLLIEVGEEDRLRRAALPGGVASLTGRVESALEQELRRIEGNSPGARSRGSLTCERPGRYWLLAPATDAVAARRLAEWIVRSIGPLASRRWAPLEVRVGTAVCPQDGRDAVALAAHADLGIYAARTAGRSSARADGPA